MPNGAEFQTADIQLQYRYAPIPRIELQDHDEPIYRDSNAYDWFIMILRFHRYNWSRQQNLQLDIQYCNVQDLVIWHPLYLSNILILSWCFKSLLV